MGRYVWHSSDSLARLDKYALQLPNSWVRAEKYIVLIGAP